MMTSWFIMNDFLGGMVEVDVVLYASYFYFYFLKVRGFLGANKFEK